MEHIEVATPRRCCCVEVTHQVEAAVRRQGLESGAALVCSLHTTAGITLNENADPDVMEDVLAALARLAPHQGSYRHAEGNSDAHLKASLIGASVTLPVEAGRLVLGRWQGIYLCEFDGPRTRRLLVQGLRA
jgi:secondary thiamine-phosphate synthase enzyme